MGAWGRCARASTRANRRGRKRLSPKRTVCSSCCAQLVCILRKTLRLSGIKAAYLTASDLWVTMRQNVPEEANELGKGAIENRGDRTFWVCSQRTREPARESGAAL